METRGPIGVGPTRWQPNGGHARSAHIHRELLVKDDVTLAVAPRLLGHPSSEDLDELVDAVRAPLTERPTTAQPRVFLLQDLSMTQPGSKVGSAPDLGILDVCVVWRAIPVDERAVDGIAVDA